jgi:Peptidase family M48
VERRIAELAAVVPVALAGAVVAILAIESVVGVDHCDTHGHHAHLCLHHGMVWAERPWAVAVVAAGMAVVAVRAVVLVVGNVRASVMVSKLRATLPGGAHVQLVPSERAFCFVAGLWRPMIYASTAARDALAPDEWAAMLAHERSHVTHRDLLHRLGLELLLVFSAPLAGSVIRERWEAATERLRDADAAERASPEAVASALVRMSRVQARPRLGAVAAFTATGAQLLTTRVASLLHGVPRGESSARRLARITLASSVAAVTLALVFAEPLHHALETLLG